MQEHIDEISALGAAPLGISVAADFQAEHLMENQIEFDLLLDPDRNFKSGALGIEKMKLWTYMTPKANWRYIKWMFKARQGRPTAAMSEPPGVAIIDADGVVQYVYKGETLGDYPPVDEVMDHLRAVSAEASAD